MIPLRDNVPSKRTPYVVYALVAANVLVFLAQRTGMHWDLLRLSMVPVNVVTGKAAAAVAMVRTSPNPFAPPLMIRGIEPPWVTLFTAMFLHGNWPHVLGNMLYLWIFGNNVEDRFGHVGFLAFYIVSGLAAAGTHILREPLSPVPTLGASGAVAGVLGAYFVLHPRARISTLVPLGFYFTFLDLPAFIVLGGWFVIQVFSASMVSVGQQSGGVAWWAHIGGFVFGVVVMLLLRGATGGSSAPGRSARTRYR